MNDFADTVAEIIHSNENSILTSETTQGVSMFTSLARLNSGRTISCVFLLTLSLGCNKPSDQVELSTQSNRNDAMQSWLSVTDDRTAVEDARNAASATKADQVAGIFDSLGTASYIDGEIINLLEENRDGSIGRLVALLQEDRVTDESVGATLLLCRMRQGSGRAHATFILQNGSADQRLRVLNGIDGGFYIESEKLKHQDFLFSDSSLVRLLLAQLDDADDRVVKAAIQCCGYLEVPGANDRFIDLLKRQHVPDKSRLLFWLSKGELTETLFDYAVEASRDVDPEDHWGATIFEAFVKSADEPLKTRAKEQLRQILKGWPDTGKQGFQGGRLSILTALSEGANEGDLDWVRGLLDSESGLYASDPLAAYIRLAPQDGRKLLIQWLHDDAKRRAAVDAASKAYEQSGDEEIVRVLAEQASRAEGRELDSVCSALSSIGGDTANEAIEAYADKLDPSSLSHYRQSRSKDSLAEIEQAVVSSDLLNAEEARAAIKQLNTEEGERTPGLFELFYAANSAIAFDAETGMLPCRHDSLVLDFAKASRGRFRPDGVLEIWHQSGDEDFDAPYTLQFVVRDTLFKAEIRNFGDWYDVERVVQTVNAALAHENVDERFIGLAAEGQVALFVFAHPDRISSVAEQFNMALSDDFESAMRQGVEFEEHVLRQLKESEK